jgi:hypothetical protein
VAYEAAGAATPPSRRYRPGAIPNWFFQYFGTGFATSLRDRGVLELPAGDGGNDRPATAN